MVQLIIFIFYPVKVDFGDRRHYQRDFFNNGLIAVYSICFAVGLGKFDDTEISVQNKAIPEGKFIVIREESFQDHEPEIMHIACIHNRKAIVEKYFSIVNQLFNHFAEHDSDLRLYPETQPEIYPYYFIILTAVPHYNPWYKEHLLFLC